MTAAAYKSASTKPPDLVAPTVEPVSIFSTENVNAGRRRHLGNQIIKLVWLATVFAPLGFKIQPLAQFHQVQTSTPTKQSELGGAHPRIRGKPHIFTPGYQTLILKPPLFSDAESVGQVFMGSPQVQMAIFSR
jgi:hypothetical protein